MDNDIRNLIWQAIDETISPEDFERLQDALEQDAGVREEYLRIVGLCESLSSIAVEAAAAEDPAAVRDPSSFGGELVFARRGRRLSAVQLLAAVAMLLVVGAAAFWLGRWNRPGGNAVVGAAEPVDENTEPRIFGHATLRRVVDLKWPQGAPRRLEGDVLPNGPLVFDAGLAEIDFFCGATLIVEGPALLDIESDWSVRVSQGRMRVSVPPAARGFVVKAADSEIIDLGTEFALEVSSDKARVEVIDGEVRLRGGDKDGQHLLTGEGASLKGSLSETSVVEGLSTVLDIDQQRQQAEAARFRQWKDYSAALRADERLIAYFPIATGLNDRVVPNASSAGSAFDGLVVGPVQRVAGRFGAASAGVEFARPGSRVRTRIDGEFQAFTFVCWARIDSLDHRYNALFMGDGYENGEPHWQIRDDGRMMFSVMVDDTPGSGDGPAPDARLHRVYFTEPFWNVSQSGRWLHLAAVYDPVGRRVMQYVNGEQVSSEEITDRYHVTALRIGAAEIGNWGQPFRKTPWFAVRNLNGTIDELALFNAALSENDIRNLYEQGKPLGY